MHRNEGKRIASVNKERRLSPLFIFVFTFTMVCFFIFYVGSDNLERLLEEENIAAAVEISILSLLLMGIDTLRKRSLLSTRREVLLISALVFLEIYIHRMLLPFFISLLYFSLVLCVFLWIFGEKEALSSLKGRIRLLVKNPKEALEIEPRYLRLIYTLPFLLIQLNRMNLVADYDSLRYGLRTQYVLFNGDFFSSLGQVNAVYSYPKGLEVLTAPLSTFRSFANSTMFQFWTLLLILLLLYQLVRKFVYEKTIALNAVLFASMISALTNMSISMKTDLLTLFFQLLMLYYFIEGQTIKGMAAGIFTYSLKPTSFVFTTISMGALILVSVAMAVFFRKDELYRKAARESFIRNRKASFISLLFCTGFTFLMTLRTYLITGVPVSTTFTALFQSMGFQVKWPFNLDASIDYGSSSGSAVLVLLRRAFQILFLPIGEDMFHVMIAWSGVMIPILLFFAFGSIVSFLKKECRFLKLDKVERRTRLYQDRKYILLYSMFIANLLFSLISLSMLWQVDGNYYILLYSLILLVAVSYQAPEIGKTDTETIVSEAASKKQLDKDTGSRGKYIPFFCFSCLYIAALFTTLITSWVGVVGFTPIDLVNMGYHDNIHEIRLEEQEKGTLELWDFLSADKKNRVLSFSHTPDAYKLMCNVQSITDVEGSGGSPGLYDELQSFEWFLRWSGTDYFYLERDFLKKEDGERNRKILVDLIEDGILLDPRIAGEYMLLSVEKERLEYVWNGEEKPELDEKKTKEILDTYLDWFSEE